MPPASETVRRQVSGVTENRSQPCSACVSKTPCIPS